MLKWGGDTKKTELVNSLLLIKVILCYMRHMTKCTYLGYRVA